MWFVVWIWFGLLMGFFCIGWVCILVNFNEFFVYYEDVCCVSG